MKTLVFKILLCLACLSVAYSQPTGVQVVQSDAPSFDFFTRIYAVSGNTTYTCFSPASGTASTVTQSAISNAASGVVTAASHGFDLNSNPKVTVTGGTSGWAAVNGTFVATIVDANSFSIPVNTSALGAVTGTIVITSAAPRNTQPVWAVKKVVTDGTNPLAMLWANGGYSNVCANRSTLSYQ